MIEYIVSISGMISPTLRFQGMGEFIKHECGLALVRQLKAPEYYYNKYGSLTWGASKLHVLMQKQRNRGQDGAGIATVKLNAPPGKPYIYRERSIDSDAIASLFKDWDNKVQQCIDQNAQQSGTSLCNTLYQDAVCYGDIFLGHLRYGTHGVNSTDACHPFHRRNSWRSRNLLIAGNFNLTNVDQLIDQLIEIGQHPIERKDTITVLEKFGHFLDREVQRLFDTFKQGAYAKKTISEHIEANLDLKQIVNNACKAFDGGFVMAGITGSGDTFVLRDAHGIRPAFYYHNDEAVVVASERPAIQTTFEVTHDKVKELPAGHMLWIRRDGKTSLEKIYEDKPKTACSFERIYFSRGTDIDIYNERRKLGESMAKTVLDRVEYDLDNTVFSYIPNTAETAFYGLVRGLEDVYKSRAHDHREQNILSQEEWINTIQKRPRVEKVAVKDVKLRTFITEDKGRDDLVQHVYDITYGTIQRNVDTLVVIDDSIVRGTTLEKSIIRILDRLGPKKIIILSSAPQIRYPDCYGIDMSKMHEFIAFRAMVNLLKSRGIENQLEETAQQIKTAFREGNADQKNFVKPLYDQFSPDDISAEISAIVKPKSIFSDVEVIYQSLEGLSFACPNHSGQWYFDGHYPTPGGRRVVNQAFLNFMEGKNVRAY